MPASEILSLPSLDWLDDSRILLTGGTGSLGKMLVSLLLEAAPRTTLVVYSRDEFKQFEMENALPPAHRHRLRFFLGDVRDGDRLRRALHDVRYVVHAAALKQVPAAEYNPFEFIKTNVIGAENVINASIDAGVERVVALSTDKAANPVNLYGATKLCSDKLFVAGNHYSGASGARFSVVRYGNVVGSRGSVIPFFLARRASGVLPITDVRMTRFWITLRQGACLVLNAMHRMHGGEIYIPKIPSMRVTDLARVVAPECRTEIVGIRPGEKLHEVMVPVDDGRSTLEFDDHFVIHAPTLKPAPAAPGTPAGRPCPDGFYYGSDNNTEWLDEAALQSMVSGIAGEGDPFANLTRA